MVVSIHLSTFGDIFVCKKIVMSRSALACVCVPCVAAVACVASVTSNLLTFLLQFLFVQGIVQKQREEEEEEALRVMNTFPLLPHCNNNNIEATVTIILLYSLTFAHTQPNKRIHKQNESNEGAVSVFGNSLELVMQRQMTKQPHLKIPGIISQVIENLVLKGIINKEEQREEKREEKSEERLDAIHSPLLGLNDATVFDGNSKEIQKSVTEIVEQVNQGLLLFVTSMIFQYT